MNRALASEWLDELPALDEQAIGSRRDLRRLNAIMRHPRIVAHALLAAFGSKPPRTLVELGAGDGFFLLRTASLLGPHWPSLRVFLVDRHPSMDESVRRGFDRIGWAAEAIGADVFDWLEDSEADLAVANLFLHHLSEANLRRLFALLSVKTNVLAACEPRRGLLPFGLSCLLGGIGCNNVTRHDAPISVRAGFRNCELSSLWPKDGWSLGEGRAGWLSHLFVARRAP